MAQKRSARARGGEAPSPRTRQVNLYDAKTHLSELVEDAARGDEIVIAKAGEPMARLVPLATSRPPRRPGAWKGRIWISDDFDAPLPDDVLAAFQSGGETFDPDA